MFNEPMRSWSENREGRTLEETVAAVAENYEKLRLYEKPFNDYDFALL